MTPEQIRICVIVLGSIAAAGFFLSVTSLYWLLRIKRTFRHDLIMLLVITDILKSFAYMALPLAVWAGTEVGSDSKYCQFSGFLMAATVEATDYVIVILAIQTALLVFRQYRDPGFGGLFQHRYILYAGWVIIPCAMASVAFVNPDNAYISIGAFCYLPPRPIWYRLTMAFIPRSLVFVSILGIYSAIYIHTMRSLKEIREAEKSTSVHQLYLEESTRTARLGSHASTTNATVDDFNIAQDELRLCASGFSNDIALAEQGHRSKPSIGSRIREMAIPVQQDSTYGGFSTLVDSTTTTSSSRAFAHPEKERKAPPVSSMEQKRIEIQRQLRLLFVYPLVYLSMWIYPMICQVIVWTPIYTSGHLPFEMRVVWGVFLSAQPGVECLVFIFREKPWSKEKSPPPAWVVSALDRVASLWRR